MVALWGHRGYSAKYPENTILSFQKAVAAGCQGVELDVHLSMDGRLVVLHDNNIARVVRGATGDVKDMTLKQIQSYNVLAPTGEDLGFNPIPTLDEYFDFAKGTPLVTNIEIKSIVHDYDNFEQRIIDCVRSHGMEERVVFSSFNHMAVARCKELAPDIACGLLVMNRMYRPGLYARRMGVEYMHPVYFVTDAQSVAEINENGVKVNAWTVNDPANMERVLRLPINAVMTDEPELYWAAMAKIEEESKA